MNGLCLECMVDETVDHVLLFCCKYVEERERLKFRVIEVSWKGFGRWWRVLEVSKALFYFLSTELGRRI